MLSSRISRYAALLACLMVWCCGAGAQEEPLRKRVAVLNFDNPDAGADAPSGLFGADGGDVGKGASTMLIQKLVQGGKYTLVDRSALAKLVKEQSEAESERVDAYALATKVGRLLGLDAMIIGAITRYGPENKPGNAGGGGFGIKTRKSKACVEITAEVLNISTGAIMADFKALGESSRTGEISIMSGGRGQAKTSMEILGSEFVESLLPEATSSAVDQIAKQLDAFAGKIPALQIVVEGRVAEVAENVLTLNMGKKSGLRIGQQIEILRETPAALDSSAPPDAPRFSQKIGRATITDLGEDYATATFSGPGTVQVGDRARLMDNQNADPH
jgi:curli biogenesis system outer membrane secretion channel CsgG